VDTAVIIEILDLRFWMLDQATALVPAQNHRPESKIQNRKS